MEGQGTSRLGRTNRRWIGGLTAAGAMAAVTLMALATASAAAPGINLHNATPLIYYSGDQSGCATAHAQKPTMSMITGTGHLNLKATAMTCFPVKGGYLQSSYGSAYAEMGAQQTLTASKAFSQFNASFNVTGTEVLSASGKIKNCPSQHYSFTYTISNSTASSTVTYNETYQDCYAEAELDIFSDSYVDDLTANSYYYAYGGSSFVQAGAYSDNYTETVNYSNPGFGTNTTYSCTTCYGSLGTGTSGAINQNMNMSTSVSIAKGDKVTMETYLYVDAYTDMYYAKGGHALSSFDAASPGHVDLVVFQLS